MSRGASAWLDKAARRLAGDLDQGRSELRFTEPMLSDARISSERHFTRGSAVKLGVAAGASLMLGVWRAPEADALDRQDCLGTCYDRVLKQAENGRRFCQNFYGSGLWKSDPNSWARAREILDEGGWGALKKMVQEKLELACETAVANRAVKDLDKCDDACNFACGRSLAGRSSRHRVCKPPPPPSPKNYTPAPPPPPNMTEDPCWACAQVGGICCGPFVANPDGSFRPCACATPGVPCERYGCGG